MKKTIISLIVTMFLISFFFISNVSAATTNKPETDEEVLFETAEITDLEVLYEKAKKEDKLQKAVDKYSVKSNGKSKKATATLKNGKNTIEVETVSTVQLLKTVKNEGLVEKTYAVTSFASPTIDELESVSTLADSSKSGSKTDSGISVKSSATIYYTESTVSGYASVDLNRTATSWSVLDGRTYIENRRIQMAAQGTNSGYYYNQVDAIRYQNTNTTATYYAPTTWKPVAKSISTFNLGVSTHVDMTRGTYNGTFSFHFRY